MVPHPLVPHPVVPALVAHAGGWDEMLLVALPVAVVAVLQVIGRRKARAQAERDAEPSPEAAGPPQD